MKTYWHQIGAPRKGRNGREEDPFPPNSESLYMHSWRRRLRLRLLSWRKIAFFLAPFGSSSSSEIGIALLPISLIPPALGTKGGCQFGGEMGFRKSEEEEKGGKRKRKRGLLLTYPTVVVRSRPGKREHIIEFGQNSTSHICTFLKRQQLSTHFLSASFLGGEQGGKFCRNLVSPFFFHGKGNRSATTRDFRSCHLLHSFFPRGVRNSPHCAQKSERKLRNVRRAK